MKYILEYKSYDNYYIRINPEEYRNMYSEIFEFSRKNSDLINDTFKYYCDSNILENDHNSGLYSKIRNNRGEDIIDLAYEDGSTCIIVKYTKSILNGRKYEKHHFVIDIYQTTDDWFLVCFFENSKIKINSLNYYKCDQIDGLLNFICDAFENPFDKINI